VVLVLVKVGLLDHLALQTQEQEEMEALAHHSLVEQAALVLSSSATITHLLRLQRQSII
jgi:hypothetical protein